jgi:hypothetical protein
MRLCTNRWTFSNFTLIACVPKLDTNKGEITQKTETVKNYSEALKNPLDDFDDHLPLMDEMMQSLDTLRYGICH